MTTFLTSTSNATWGVTFQAHTLIPVQRSGGAAARGALTPGRLARMLHMHLNIQQTKLLHTQARDTLTAIKIVNRINQVGPAMSRRVVRNTRSALSELKTMAPNFIDVMLGQSWHASGFFRPAPAWTLIVPASFFTLLWLLGLPLLYLLWRKRELTPWQPQSADMPATATPT